ncbi:MAG: Na/Pi symporter, partial [Clostridia bacterium]|nr:Na/Pi symporter [Clostridia bacterium]
ELNENGLLSSFFSRCSSRFSGLLFGFVSTALVQSSSATVGILQSLVSVGAVSRESAVFIICGQNIGATVPTLLSALCSDKKAKAAALFHLLFNLFGTASVIIVSLFEKIEKGEVFVSAVHVLFNVLCTVVMFPFSTVVTEISEKIAGLFERKSNRHSFSFLSESTR